MPSAGQIVVVVLAIAMFVIGGGISLSRLWIERPWSRLGAKSCMYMGLLFALVAQIWHGVARGSVWPLEDNFDSMIWLAMGLALFVMYIQRRKPLPGLDWFIMPVVILLLIAAAITGRTNWQPYEANDLWNWVHRAGTYGGAAVFAIAGAAGCMYLIANRRLRNKVALGGPNLGSLERLEHLTFASVTLGFALLTIGAITGFARLKYEHGAVRMTEVVMGSIVWLIYAVVLHSPMNPSFRGRRAAILSIVGFVLMVGTVVAVLVMPSSG